MQTGSQLGAARIYEGLNNLPMSFLVSYTTDFNYKYVEFW